MNHMRTWLGHQANAMALKLNYLRRDMLLLLAVVGIFLPSLFAADPINVVLNPRRVVHIVNDHFVSFTINPTDLLQGRPFGLRKNTTLAMMKELSPAFIRLGGPDTNKYLFKNSNTAEDMPRSSEQLVITEDYWRDLNEFLRRAGLDAVVCLNSGHRSRTDDIKWDPRNALQLISFSDRHQYNLTWELGYEPIRSENITGTQFGKDINQLRSILNAFPRYRDSQIIGPDIRAIHRKEDVNHVLDILIEAGPSVNAVTWHPRWPHVSAITPSDASEDGYDFPPDYLEWDRNQLHKYLQRAILKKPFWIGEPKNENTGSFAEGLIFARRLAIAAKLGVEVVMKQPSLKDIAHPKPEYWMALLHKKTLGRTILDARPTSNHSEVSLVIQCTRQGYQQEQDGGVTVLAVNTAGVEQRAIVRGLPHGHYSGEVHQYVLTAGKQRKDIFSQMTYLNGEPLLMSEDGKLPEFIPKTRYLGPNLIVKLPPYSAGFWVVPQAKVKLCQQEPGSLMKFVLEELNNADLIKTTEQGINSLLNMNQIMVSKLLNPVASEEVEEGVETQKDLTTEGKKSKRQVSVSDIGLQLKERMKKIHDIIHLNLERMGETERKTSSEENGVRTAEVELDGLADDLTHVISAGNQEREFGKFLDASGLKTNFGKLMMEERMEKQNIKPKLDDEFELADSEEKSTRYKRSNSFLKDGHLDWDALERRFQRIIAKQKKPSEPIKYSNMEFGKINKELQEELLLKEITLLEKTEETLAEVMKSHLERTEALEELMQEELEEMKDEKLAALIEIKTEGIRKQEDSNKSKYRLNLLDRKATNTKDGERQQPKKREALAEEEKNSEKNKTVDPFVAIKNYLAKRKEELSKRTNIHEKLEEMRKKLKEDATKLKLTKDVTTKAPTTFKTTEVSKVKETTTEATTPLSTREPINVEKRRAEVLKYMTEYIDQIHSEENKKTDQNDDNSFDLLTKRKPRKTNVVTSKQPANDGENALISTVKASENEPPTFPNQPATTTEKVIEESETAATYVEKEGTEGSSADGTEKYEEDKEDTIQNAIVQSPEGQRSPVAAEKKSVEQEIHENNGSKISTANGDPKKNQRKRRDLRISPEAAEKIDPRHKTYSQALSTNSIVKKVIRDDETTTTEPSVVPDDILTMAGKAIKAIIDDVVPKAYQQAKEKLEELELPAYLKSLEKMMEKFQNMDSVVKDFHDLVQRSNETDPSEHIQKISRNRRSSDDLDNSLKESLEEKENGVQKELEEPNNDKKNEMHAKEEMPEDMDALENQMEKDVDQALEEMAAEIVEKEAVERTADLLKEEENEENGNEVNDDPATPGKAAEEDIIKQIITKLIEKQRIARNKNKREVPPLYLMQRNQEKLKETLPSTYSLPVTPDESVSQFLRKLRPGVYVVPSENMANVHAEQMAKTAVNPKDGKVMPNVMTLNIYYEKKPKTEQYQPEMAPAEPPHQHYKYGNSQPWPTQQVYSPPAPPVVSQQQFSAIPISPPLPAVRKMMEPRYPPMPLSPTYANHRGPPAPRYLNPKPYIPDPYLYQQPPSPVTPGPKLIPISPFNDWSKKEEELTPEMVGEGGWKLSKQEPAKDASSEEEYKSEEKPSEPSSWYLRKTSENPPVYVKKPLPKKETDLTFFDKKESIEPFWNRTLKEIFQETSKDPFWKFLESDKKEDTDTNTETVEVSTISPPIDPEQARKKRSINYNPKSIYENELDTKPFSNAWLEEQPLDVADNFDDYDNLIEDPDPRRYRRSMRDNLIMKQRIPERLPLESDHIVHKRFPRKQFKRFSDPDSSLEVGQPIATYRVIATPNEVLEPSTIYRVPSDNGCHQCSGNKDATFSFPVEQLYDMAIDFIKRIIVAS